MKVTYVRGILGIWGNDEVGGKGKEVLEGDGKRVFENRKCCLEEVVSWVWKVVEEDTLNRVAIKPWNVEESEGESCW